MALAAIGGKDGRFRCSGRTAGATVACAFTTDSESAVFQHHEETDHDVDESPRPMVAECWTCEVWR